MTLQFVRDPLTFAGAAARVIQLVGAQVAGDKIGRKDSLIYKWARPGKTDQPKMWMATALDNLCAELHGETPFFDASRYQLQAKKQPSGCVRAAVRKVAIRSTELNDRVHEALEGDEPTPAEKTEIKQLVQSIERKLRVVRVRFDVPREAAE